MMMDLDQPATAAEQPQQQQQPHQSQNIQAAPQKIPQSSQQTTRQDTSSEATQATRIEEYVLGKELGRGSFAKVYLGVHEHTQEQKAIKRIDRSRLSTKLLQNLEQEISILRNSQHPNIVMLNGIKKTRSHIFLVLEFCAGGDLSKFIKSRGRLSERVARHFLRHLAGGLEFLWRHQHIHRDIKPQNLLLTANEETATLKIADFGFARHLAESALADTLCGSPLYMAPEILSFQKYDAKADLWSVGAVLFEMVAGQPPYGGANQHELIENIRRKELRLPKGITISHPCVVMIQMLLQRKPAQRASFEKFLAADFLKTSDSGNKRRPSSSDGAAATDPGETGGVGAQQGAGADPSTTSSSSPSSNPSAPASKDAVTLPPPAPGQRPWHTPPRHSRERANSVGAVPSGHPAFAQGEGSGSAEGVGGGEQGWGTRRHTVMPTGISGAAMFPSGGSSGGGGGSPMLPPGFGPDTYTGSNTGSNLSGGGAILGSSTGSGLAQQLAQQQSFGPRGPVMGQGSGPVAMPPQQPYHPQQHFQQQYCQQQHHQYPYSSSPNSNPIAIPSTVSSSSSLTPPSGITRPQPKTYFQPLTASPPGNSDHMHLYMQHLHAQGQGQGAIPAMPSMPAMPGLYPGNTGAVCGGRPPLMPSSDPAQQPYNPYPAHPGAVGSAGYGQAHGAHPGLHHESLPWGDMQQGAGVMAAQAVMPGMSVLPGTSPPGQHGMSATNSNSGDSVDSDEWCVVESQDMVPTPTSSTHRSGHSGGATPADMQAAAAAALGHHRRSGNGYSIPALASRLAGRHGSGVGPTVAQQAQAQQQAAHASMAAAEAIASKIEETEMLGRSAMAVALVADSLAAAVLSTNLPKALTDGPKKESSSAASSPASDMDSGSGGSSGSGSGAGKSGEESGIPGPSPIVRTPSDLDLGGLTMTSMMTGASPFGPTLNPNLPSGLATPSPRRYSSGKATTHFPTASLNPPSASAAAAPRGEDPSLNLPEGAQNMEDLEMPQGEGAATVSVGVLPSPLPVGLPDGDAMVQGGGMGSGSLDGSVGPAFLAPHEQDDIKSDGLEALAVNPKQLQQQHLLGGDDTASTKAQSLSEALVLYVKAMGLVRRAIERVKTVHTDLEHLTSATASPHHPQSQLAPDQVAWVRFVEGRAAELMNWLSGQFGLLLERAEQCRRNQGATDHTATVTPAEMIIWVSAQTLAQSAAVKELLGQGRKSQKMFKHSRMLIKALLLEPELSDHDRQVLLNCERQFDLKINEMARQIQAGFSAAGPGPGAAVPTSTALGQGTAPESASMVPCSAATGTSPMVTS